MKTYKVLVHGGLEGLEFEDLITEKDGISKVVIVRKGDCVPTRSINPDMLNKSLNGGCLGRSIKAGWVIEVEEGQVASVVEKVENKVLEQPVIVNVEEKPKEIIVDDGSKIMDNSKPEIKEEVITLDDFNKMKHFAKIALISKCTDKELLKEIVAKVENKKLQLNAGERLKSLET